MTEYSNNTFYDMAMFKSYKQTAEWFSKGRNPEYRPVRSWARLYKVGDNYELRQGTTICTITPDNVLTFNLTHKQAYGVSVTLSSSLQKVVPIVWTRVSKYRYAIMESRKIDTWRTTNNNFWYFGKYLSSDGEELFDGIQYDLDTGKCLNPQPKLLDTVNKENRIEWLRTSRKFKRGIQIRAKMGVLETICQQVAQSRTKDKNTWVEPDWHHDKWIDLLYTSVKNNEYSTELLTGFVRSSPINFWRHEVPTTASTLKAVEMVFRDVSIPLRKKFSVFDTENKDA